MERLLFCSRCWRFWELGILTSWEKSRGQVEGFYEKKLFDSPGHKLPERSPIRSQMQWMLRSGLMRQ